MYGGSITLSHQQRLAFSACEYPIIHFRCLASQVVWLQLHLRVPEIKGHISAILRVCVS